MTGPQTPAEARLRQLFRDAAADIGPIRLAPAPGSRPSPPGGRARPDWCSAWPCASSWRPSPQSACTPGAAGAPGSLGGTGGTLLVIRSDGAVEVLAPDTGAVLRTLVGPSPVDAAGRHLAAPVALTATATEAYIAFGRLNSTIERVPGLGGGPMTYVTNGFDPSVSPDGAELAVFRLSAATATGSVVVRDLATGLERTVDVTKAGTVLDGLSWSSDDSQLALSGVFMNEDAATLLGDISVGVQLLTLTQPASPSNPRFVGTPASIASGAPTWTDAQFRGTSSDVAVLVSSPGDVCQARPTTVESVDPTTAQRTTVAGFGFSVAHAVFDRSGDLVAYERSQPESCAAPATTTTTTPAGEIGRVATSGGGSITASAVRTVLYRWAAGTSTHLADDVVAATFVPPAP